MGQQFFEANETLARSLFGFPTIPSDFSFDYTHPSYRPVAESILAAVLIVLLCPILALCYFAVKASSKGPGFYFQERVGQYGRVFHILKFRTMVVGAEEETGAILSWKGDHRITRVGRFLRDTHLDELPQLL